MPNAQDKSAEATAKGHLTGKISREAQHYDCEENAKVENRSRDFHRQVDTQGFILAEQEALSTRAVAPSAGKGVSAYAYQNAAQPGIQRFNRAARDASETHCGRVFVNPTRKDIGLTARRHVPLGETKPQASECRSRASAELEIPEEAHMCPACIASTALIVAAAGSTGGILAACAGKFGKLFRLNRPRQIQKTKEK
jgi:hypothetical protein